MSQESDVDRLIEQIVAKLTSAKPVLARSLEFGRVTWRREANGRVVIKVQPEL